MFDARIGDLMDLRRQIQAAFLPVFSGFKGLSILVESGRDLSRDHILLPCSIMGLAFPGMRSHILFLSTALATLGLISGAPVFRQVGQIIDDLRKSHLRLGEYQREQENAVAEIQSRGETIRSQAQSCLRLIEQMRRSLSQGRDAVRVFQESFDRLTLQARSVFERAEIALRIALEKSGQALELIEGIKTFQGKTLQRVSEEKEAFHPDPADLSKSFSDCERAYALCLESREQFYVIVDGLVEIQDVYGRVIALQRQIFEIQEGERRSLEEGLRQQEGLLRAQTEETSLMIQRAREGAGTCREAAEILSRSQSSLSELHRSVNLFYASFCSILSCAIGVGLWSMGFGVRKALLLSVVLVACAALQFFSAQRNFKTGTA